MNWANHRQLEKDIVFKKNKLTGSVLEIESALPPGSI